MIDHINSNIVSKDIKILKNNVNFMIKLSKEYLHLLDSN